jgi:hypothetical protein
MGEPMTEAVIVDPVLGALKRLDAFTHGRQVPVDGREVQLVIETGEGLTPEALTQARRLFGAFEELTKRCRRFAAESLVDSKNDAWRGDDSDALTSGELEAQLSVEACEIAADGVATLYFGSGELFGGHSVVVYVDPSGAFADVKLAG